MKTPNDAKWEDNPVSIKHYVKRYIQQNRARLQNKVVIDAAAGSGLTARLLQEAGAHVHAFDLFPEYFKAPGLVCQRANIVDGLPVPDEFADFLICQEGIEHFSDQYRALREFNRVLKKGGTLLITTPNSSNLKARLSHFLFETEYIFKKMPSNEIDSVWMSRNDRDEEIYVGHYFLIGVQRLRGLAKLSGFRIRDIIFTQVNNTSAFLLPFFYPWLLFAGWWTYRHYVRQFRKNRKTPPGSPYPPERERVYRELMQLNTHLGILLDKNLFVEFEKEADLAAVKKSFRSQHPNFDIIP